MMPLECRGVVDNVLKVTLTFHLPLGFSFSKIIQVYHTTNIRVVDISIIPLHIGAHTQGKCYFS